jgi:hypothetical protein
VASLCPSVRGLSRARLEPVQPIGRPVRPNRRSSSCRAPHLPFAPVPASFLQLTFSWAAALLQYTFTVANVLPPSDCILPQSFFLGPGDCLFVLHPLAIAVRSLLNRTYYRRLAGTTELRPFVVNICILDTDNYPPSRRQHRGPASACIHY